MSPELGYMHHFYPIPKPKFLITMLCVTDTVSGPGNRPLCLYKSAEPRQTHIKIYTKNYFYNYDKC